MNGLTERPSHNGIYFFRIKTLSYLDGHGMIIDREVTSGFHHTVTETSLFLKISALLQRVQLDAMTALLLQTRDL